MKNNQLVQVFKNIKGLKIIRVNMGVFNTWVRIAVGPAKNIHAYVRWADRQPDFVYQDSEIVWIPRKPRTPEEHGTLAHECLHAAFYLMDWLGMNANQETCEVMAHATGWLVKNALKHS